MSTRPVKVLFSILFSIAACSEALACSCGLLSAHDRYRNAAAVFVGPAVSKTFFGSGIRFHIEESFWGTTGDSVTVKQYDPVICDSFAFRVGQKYLIVAYRQGSELTVTACNQGAGIKFAAGDVHVLREQRQGKSLPYVYGVLTTKDEMPLSNAAVALQKDANPAHIIAQTRTAADGYFEFQKVPPGGYLVVALPGSGATPIKRYFETNGPGVRLILHSW